MVRPVDLTDSMNKAETVQRLQQNQKVQPEAALHNQKTFSQKLSEQVTTPNPVTRGDEVVIHVDEKEEERRKVREAEERARREKEEEEEKKDDADEKDDGDAPPHEHIDIKF